MRVLSIHCLSDNYAYLLDLGDGGALVVDASEPAPVLSALEREGLRPVALLCTHHHYDHVGGNEGLRERYPELPIYGHRSDQEKGRIPGQSEALEHGEARSIAGVPVQVLHIPGHTLGAVAYYLPGEGAVFTGDTLFGAGCGRLFEGTPEMMHASLSLLAALPGETKVYCGHEYTLKNLDFAAAVEPDSRAIAARKERVAALRQQGQPSVPSTLAEELATNPFLRAAEPAVAARARKEEPAVAADAGPAAIFGALRRWKDRF